MLNTLVEASLRESLVPAAGLYWRTLIFRLGGRTALLQHARISELDSKSTTLPYATFKPSIVISDVFFGVTAVRMR